jgi:hypothetical protein
VVAAALAAGALEVARRQVKPPARGLALAWAAEGDTLTWSLHLSGATHE